MLGKNKKSTGVKKFLTAQQWEAKPHTRQGSSSLTVFLLPACEPKLTRAQSRSRGCAALCAGLARRPEPVQRTEHPASQPLSEQEGRIIKNPLVSNKSNAEPFPWRAGRGAQLRGLSPQRERAGGRRSGASSPLTPAETPQPGERRARGAPRGRAALTGSRIRASPSRGRKEPGRRAGRWPERLRRAAAPNSCALRRPPPTAGG